MSDLKDEDLLLGDDDIEQALYGADEDELLLTDEELEKDVTNEEKQQMKAEAEQWVREQIQDKQKRPQRSKIASSINSAKGNEKTIASCNAVPPSATNEVSSTANNANGRENVNLGTMSGGDDVSTSEAVSPFTVTEFKTPPQTQSATSTPAIHLANLHSNTIPGLPPNFGSPATTNTDDAISSSSKDVDTEHASVISCSTNITDSSALASSQESLPTTGTYADPREDCEDEREERTNIKTTNERELESASSSDQSPEKQRFNQNRRFPVDNFNPMIRPHRYRLPYHPGPRPLMNRGPFPPMPHGNFALVYAPPNPVENSGGVGVVPAMTTSTLAAAAATVTLINTISSPSPLPGHFPPQHPAQNTPPHNMYGPAGTQHPPLQPHIGIPPAPTPQNMSTVPPPSYAHDMMQRLPLRHPYPGFRPGGPMGANFPRHPVHGNMYGSPEYNGPPPPHFGQNFSPHGPRGMFRPEMQQGMPPRMPSAPGVRMQRTPMPPHNLVSAAGFANAPPPAANALRQPAPSQQPPPQGALPPGTNVPTAPNPVPVSVGIANVVPATPLRPNKVLINPNFKGGVEAAKSKFIQETQYMAALGGVCRSDDELLRQQEEFINKNRQHIEKRRNERAASPTAVRRSRSRSRTRSRSRERSYTPPSKRSGGDRYFERGTARASSRERERERDRDRERAPYSNRPGAGGNRFRRANSRDRGNSGDYDSRGGYSKRRRSISPAGNRGSGNGFSGRGRARSGERDRNEDEDDETRAYRLKIEKQKELREKIMRDKEMKRRRAAEEKQYEEKRTAPQANNGNQNNSAASTNSSANVKSHNNSNNSNNPSSNDEPPQKLKPIIVTQPKIISLKKRQQQNENERERERERERDQRERERDQRQQHFRGNTPPPRRQLPTAKILPEAKRTLTEHLTGGAGTGSSCSGSGAGSSHQHSNTAIIKPVQKTREIARRLTPPLPGASTSLPAKHTRRLSTPSDDEVQLDCDDDELMLDEEDRLLASPTPSPKHRSAAATRMSSRTPSPEPPLQPQYKSKTHKSSSSSSFTTNNRRVVLKSSSQSARLSPPTVSEATAARSRRGNSRQRDAKISAQTQSTRKGIFDRLNVRSSGSGGSGTGGGSTSLLSDPKRKAHRIVLKHD